AASLPQPRDALRVDWLSPSWSAIPENLRAQWAWCVDVLFRTPGNDGQALVRRSRAAMLSLGVALGLLLAGWAWKLGGPAAAVAATALFALDPSFLGHAPLVKND